ncbi:MAG TPA: hypothetical protein VF746_16735 [Longimicrobium sp.]|jgi:hypothetical protein
MLVLLASGIAATLPCPSAAQVPPAATADSGSPTLERRMKAFLEAVRRGSSDSIATFFPRAGDFTYLHTEHRADGTRVGTWRFPAAEAPRAIGSRGPLWESFTIQFEGQPIGRFAHQVMHRGTAWSRARGNRFVPPGASPASGIFVEWRQENGTWVISAFADESFKGVPLPSWCC